MSVCVGDRVVTKVDYQASTHHGPQRFPAGLSGAVSIAPFVKPDQVYVDLDNGWSLPCGIDEIRPADQKETTDGDR